MKYATLLISTASLTLFGWGCEKNQEEPETETPPMGQAPPPAADPGAAQPGTPSHVALKTATLKVENETLYGDYLVNEEGKALYMFEQDVKGSGASTCYDECANIWPPVLTKDDVKLAAPQLKESLLGTLTRTNGAKQVTYGGWPLYTYFKDSPDIVSGQDLFVSGAKWYLVSPDGEKIEATKPDDT